MKKLMILLIALMAMSSIFAAALSEGFEGTTCPATDWTIRYANASPPAGNLMTHTTTFFRTGLRSFRFSSFSSGSPYDQYLITPRLNVSSGDQTVSFYYRKYTSGSESFQVGWSSTDNANASFTWTTAITNATTTWQQYTKTDLPVGTKYVAVKYANAYNYYLYIDDFAGPELYVANDPEPTNHVTDFASSTITSASIKLTWTGATGAQLPAKYLILAKKGAGSYATVADGTPVADDADWSNNNAAVNVIHAVGANSYTFNGLTMDTAYSFVIYPYTNAAANINFKTDGIVPSVSVSTGNSTVTVFPWSEGFEGAWAGLPSAPQDWSQITVSGTAPWQPYTYSPHSGTSCARAPYQSDGGEHLLITPPLSLGTTDYRLKFWLKGSSSLGTDLKVQIATSNSAAANFTTDLAYYVAGTNMPTVWTEQTINLAAYEGIQYIAFRLLDADGYSFYIDDITIEAIPAGAVIAVSPTTWDFGNVDVVAPASKVFTISNTGAANLVMSSVVANGSYYSITVAPAMTVAPGNSTTFTVQFAPTVVGGPYTGDITINDNTGQTVIPLTGSGIARPAGSTCGNPLDVTLPLVGFTGDTSLYGDDYDSGWVTPSSYYLTGDDMVLRFTLALPSTLSGNISTTSSYPGLFILGQEPNASTPAPILGIATSSGTSATMTPVVLPAGTYFAIVSSWTSPQSIPFTLNLSAVPLSNDPEPSAYPTAFTFGTTSTTSIQLNWTGSVGTQLPSKYLILAKKAGGTFATVTDGVPVANDSDWTNNNAAINVAHVVGANTYTFTGLTQATSYDFVIYPYTNELGNTNYKTDGTPPAFTKATVDPNVPMPLPYVQNFDSGTTLAGINWTGDMSISATHGASGTNGLYRNLWSSATTTNVVSCPIGPMVANAELKFDYRIVNYTGYPATATAITTDTIVAQVSTDGGLTFTTVYTINQGNHVTSTAFATVIVPLAAYSTGNIKVKLLSTWGAGDYYVDIDNVVVRVTPVGPPDAVTLVSPVDNAADLPKNGFNLTWAPAATGGTPTSYTVYMATSAETIYEEEIFNGITSTSFNPVTDGLMSFNYEERWFWTVEAVNNDGSAVVDPPISFTIEADPSVSVPYLENFDALTIGDMPNNMTIFGSNAWQAAANIAPNSMPNCAVAYYDSYYDKDEWMITPPIKMVANQLYTISFALKAPGWEGVPEALAVHYGTAPTIVAMNANTPLYDNANITQADWTTIQRPFTPSTTGNYYFGWHAYTDADNDYIAVDDISIFIPAALDLAVTGLGGDTVGFVDSPVTNVVTVANMGATAMSSYTVYIKNAVGDAVLAQETINVALPAAGSADHDLSWTPTTAGTISVYAEVVATGDLVTANNVSAAMDVTIYPASMNLLYVGDPATNWVTSSYPFNMYWEDFVAESVYLASEIQASAGTIKAISYFNNFPTEETKQVQVWMQNTSQADASAGWLP
ncbi:MAG: choice-of-anchor J domain-containing protein, partial [Candidatus Cloacimonetes bacterium]|nr:choice-of-anchor J domain-containing protein [Candidatus Cloacimonadota bacterium]